MLHRFRRAMVTPGRNKLSGEVEVDETFVGGKNKPGKRGRGAAGKVIVAVAIERNTGGRGFGRARLEVIPHASGSTLRDFISRNIAPGSTVITDALQSYNIIAEDGFVHEPINVKRSGLKAHEVLPGVHRVASLLKSWLKGTLQGGVSPEHLQAYLEEFTFRFNRGTRASAVCCSSASSSRPWRPTRSPTRTSSPSPSPSRSTLHHR